MSASRGYLLDTNILLHVTRDSDVSRTVDARFELSASRFRPAICEVSLGELKAFARAWGETRRERLLRVIDELLVVQLSEPGMHDSWAALYSHARKEGLPIQQDHNDMWIAAASRISGLTLLSMDAAAFLPLRDTEWVDVVVLDARGNPRL